MNRYTAGRLIRDVPRREMLITEWGNTKDIINAIMRVVDKDHLKSQVGEFAEKFKGDTPQETYDSLLKLWRFCRSHIRYKKDPKGVQYIKHPGRVIKDGYSDCKGLSILIYHVCRYLELPVFIRFSSYERDRRIGHVYPMVVIGNEAIPVDAVFEYFDAEEKPTYYKDYYPAVYRTAELKSIARQSHPAVLAGIVEGMPQWMKGMFAGLSFYQAYNSKNMVLKGAYTILGGYYTKQFFSK
ncbi:MAG: hypothetical protein AAFZ15_17275 [Bacteroidota bacterium]